ncbi:MAG: Gfo/Idh/MocA family oxidoreductase [Armatimonadota bacterium]|nr:Gfo/Idh/MocA family oxidoreductase [Armatimonadota bacterium]
MKRFGLGFIGCGGYGTSLADAAARSEKLALIACWDIVQENAAALAQKYGLRQCATLDELLSLPDVEGVVVASPNNAHRENAVAAASAGKHVFVDKPIANTMEDAWAIVDATSEAGVVLAVGHNTRRSPGHRKMKELVDMGAVGTPVTVEANFSHSGGMTLKPNQWRYTREGCPALPLMQLGVHFADTIQYLLGDVLEVASFMSHVVIPADNVDATVSVLRFRGGFLGYLGSNYATPSVFYVNIYGTGGNLYCEGGGQLFYKKAGSSDKEPVSLTPVDTQVEQLEEFAICARTGARPEVDGIAAIKALAIVRAALKSDVERRPVTTAEVIGRKL